MNLRILLSLFLISLLAACATVPSKSGLNNGESGSGQVINDPLEKVGLVVVRPITVDLVDAPQDIWTRIRQGYMIPDLQSDLVTEWENYYAARPQYIQRTTERAGKYLFYIVDEIDKRGLPTELALLPFIESSFNPTALSSANASGLWQFIPSTGRSYNLKQDWWRDERRDPIASTNAALDYLTYLREFQGDWHLALASYNWGEGSVKRAINKNIEQNLDTDYASLKMPDETRNYVPKLQAIKNIIAHPEKFNIQLPHVANQPYFVTVSQQRTIDVDVAAKLAEMSLDEFKSLNPSFQRAVILGDKQGNSLLLPQDKVEIFEKNLQTYDGALSTWKVYTVQAKETVSSLAKIHGISPRLLREANALAHTQEKLIPGTQMIIPDKKDANIAVLEKTLTRSTNTTTNSNSNNKVRSHTVVKGDVLGSIAVKYGITVNALQKANRLGGNSVLKIGQVLIIPR